MSEDLTKHELRLSESAQRLLNAACAFAEAGTRITGSLDSMPSAIIHEVYDAVREFKKAKELMYSAMGYPTLDWQADGFGNGWWADERGANGAPK